MYLLLVESSLATWFRHGCLYIGYSFEFYYRDPVKFLAGRHKVQGIGFMFRTTAGAVDISHMQNSHFYTTANVVEEWNIMLSFPYNYYIYSL